MKPNVDAHVSSSHHIPNITDKSSHVTTAATAAAATTIWIFLLSFPYKCRALSDSNQQLKQQYKTELIKSTIKK